MALEPITRQEQIIAGKELKPITRMEKFLKQYGGGSGDGGGAGETMVHITSNDSAPWWSADKTFAEIAEAIEAEKKVTAVTVYGEYLYLTMFVPGEMIGFSSTTCYMNEGGNPDFGIRGLVITPETVNYFGENLEV